MRLELKRPIDVVVARTGWVVVVLAAYFWAAEAGGREIQKARRVFSGQPVAGSCHTQRSNNTTTAIIVRTWPCRGRRRSLEAVGGRPGGCIHTWRAILPQCWWRPAPWLKGDISAVRKPAAEMGQYAHANSEWPCNNRPRGTSPTTTTTSSVAASDDSVKASKGRAGGRRRVRRALRQGRRLGVGDGAAASEATTGTGAAAMRSRRWQD